MPSLIHGARDFLREIEAPTHIEICEISPDGTQIYIRTQWADGTIVEGWQDCTRIMVH